MKIWHGYGSDHSSALVMIGRFKTLADARKAHEMLGQLTECATEDLNSGVIDYHGVNDDFSEATKEKMRDLKLFSLSPADIADLALLDARIEQNGTEIRIRSDDVDIGGFVKLMVAAGAAVEVFSAHEFPEKDK